MFAVMMHPCASDIFIQGACWAPKAFIAAVTIPEKKLTMPPLGSAIICEEQLILAILILIFTTAWAVCLVKSIVILLSTYWWCNIGDEDMKLCWYCQYDNEID